MSYKFGRMEAGFILVLATAFCVPLEEYPGSLLQPVTSSTSEMNTYELKQREVLTVRDGSQNEATPSQQDRDEAAMAKFGKKQQLRVI
ncbi:MAG: hypothetical protein M1821_008192 [Bathelium mastoideum]|nr:MAG: hypothetical protein M1821_008192 [Bathelium mastoideum]